MNVWYKYNAWLAICFRILLFCTMFFYQNVKAQPVSCQQSTGPYTQSPLPGQVFIQTQTYREATDYQGKTVRLAADIYRLPSGLPAVQLRERPLVVILHGGGIKFGSRQTGLQPFIAQYLAQRGYVVVCADYRLGWDKAYDTQLCGQGTESDYLDAQYRAMQDERALIKYLKRQANTIGFDTSRIFLMGVSSGATLALARLESNRIGSTDTRTERLGALESNASGNESSEVAGIISIAGANLIDRIAPDFNTPTLFFHGTCDNAVAYRTSRLAGCPNLGLYYGPGELQPLLQQKGVCNRLLTFCGFGHDFLAKEDQEGSIGFGVATILQNSIQFMLDVLCDRCTAEATIVNEAASIEPVADCSRINEFDLCGSILPPEQTLVELHPEVLTQDRRLYIKSNFDFERKAELRMYDAAGRLVFSQEFTFPTGAAIQDIVAPVLPKGIYLYEIVSGTRRWRAGKILGL
jgi:dienelactone hydrolase